MSRRLDVLLVLMVLIWGANYSVMKRAFAEMPPMAFNSLRLIVGSALFYAAIRWVRRAAREPGNLSSIFHTPTPLTRRDRLDLVWLGLIGHTGYQLCFATGVARTTASNGALIIGASPVVVAGLSALLGRERLGPLHWVGAAISAFGIYTAVGLGASFDDATWRGDLLMLAAVGCWAAYTLGGSQLMARHSPLYVTGMTMVIGTVPYVLLSLPSFAHVQWAGVGWITWVSLVLSAMFALCISYLIWYAAVQRLGPSRTAIYSNMIPLVAITIAALWLGEAVTANKILGALAVLAGVLLTRFARRVPPVT